MNYLSVENITKSIGDRVLFSDLKFGLEKGQKTALVAQNGTGKTTILKMLAGIEPYDSGIITFRNGIKISYLPQDPTFTASNSIFEEILQANTPQTKAVRDYELAKLSGIQEDLEKAMADVEETQAWTLEGRISEIMGQLKLDNITQPVSMLSGGQQKRVALAKCLLEEPDFLLLDEPTNHLDISMIEWLEKYFNNPNFTLLMITHDRYFLDAVCNDIIELENNTIYRYRGNYTYFLEKKQERIEAQTSEIEKAKNTFRKELDWMRRQPQARATKAKARIDAFYDVKDKASQRINTEQVALEINMQRLGGKVVELHAVSKGYSNRTLINNFTYKFQTGDRVGVVGPNGAGKSTLLKLITGQIDPDKGKIVHGETVMFGHYKQEGLNVDDTKRVIEVVRDIADVIPLAKGKSLTAAQLLERFLFSREKQYTQVGKLSGGERKRLYLLTVLIKNPNFLILDEPTNDLDILTLNVLEDFLDDYPGCLLVVSHDRYFMDRLVDHMFVFEQNGAIRDFPGNYTEYRLNLASEIAANRAAKNNPPAPVVQKVVEEEKPKKQLKLSFKEKFEFEQLEKELPALEKRKVELSEKLSSGITDTEAIMKISDELTQLVSELEEKEMRWLEISDKMA